MKTMGKQRKDLVAVVPVRSGSKGLPGKNLRPLGDIPLYLHAVYQGLRTVGKVVLSTDIEEINQKDLPENCTLCPRPSELAGDDTPMASVIEHVIETHSLQDNTLVLLQATSPLREDDDINIAIALHEEARHDLVMSVVESDSGVLKYGTLSDGDFTAMRDPSFCFQNRQNLPIVHKPNGSVYVFTAASFMSSNGFPSERIGAIEMPVNRSLDIDKLEDFLYVEKLATLGRAA